MGEIYDEIMDLQRKVICDLIYQKIQELGGKLPKTTRIFRIEYNQGSIVTDHLRVVWIWYKHIK